MRTLAAILSLAACVVLGWWGMALATELPPCATEDSVSCYWDAATMGNGVGQSFTVDHNGKVTFTK